MTGRHGDRRRQLLVKRHRGSMLPLLNGCEVAELMPRRRRAQRFETLCPSALSRPHTIVWRSPDPCLRHCAETRMLTSIVHEPATQSNRVHKCLSVYAC